MIWYRDLNGFLDTAYLFDIVPSTQMTFSEKLNAVFRFSIYSSIVLYALSNNPNSFLVIVIIGVITYLLNISHVEEPYMHDTYGDNRDPNNKAPLPTGYTVPTKDNPFMNVLMNEYAENPTRNPAVYNKQVKQQINDYFNENLYRSIDDIYQKNASDRQYYTMPNTMIPNDQEKFANWLYRVDGKTCKEGNASKCKYFS